MLGTFDYIRARSLREACLALAEPSNETRVLAGGTDLLVDLRNGICAPALLVDIKEIGELKTIERSNKAIRIGAAASLNAIAETAAVRQTVPGLVDAVLSIGTYQLRNRATLAGNLCNGSPAADSAPVLLCLGASVIARSACGSRTIPIDELFLGVKKTSVRPDEIVTHIEIPLSDSVVRTAFSKQQRIRGHDLAVVNVAGRYAAASGELRIAIGSCGPTPLLLPPFDVSNLTFPIIVDRVVRTASDTVSPINDVRASAEYRRAVLATRIERLLEQLIGRTGGLR